MGRKSTKENKNIYQTSRETMEYTRDAAAEKLGFISADRNEKIENEKSLPHPEEVLAMADCYKNPSLCNYFCSHECPIGIEYVPEAIEDARINARDNGIENCEFFAGDMKDILTDDFVNEHGHPDVIILDPPRAGIHPDVAKVILNAEPSKIVYVSCNPASQARDLEILCSKYDITAVRPVDMFPHTHHVENVVALRLKN